MADRIDDGHSKTAVPQPQRREDADQALAPRERRIWWYRDQRTAGYYQIELPWTGGGAGTGPHALRLIEVAAGDLILRFDPNTAEVYGVCEATEPAKEVGTAGASSVVVGVTSRRCRPRIQIRPLAGRLAPLAADATDDWPIGADQQVRVGSFYRFSDEGLRVLLASIGQTSLAQWMRSISQSDEPAEEVTSPTRSPRVWWAMVGRQASKKQYGDCLWAMTGTGKRDWNRISELRTDDVVVTYGDGQVTGLYRVTGDPQQSTVPPGYLTDKPADTPGMRVPVKHHAFARPLPNGTFAAALLSLGLDDGPLRSNTDGKIGFIYELTPEGLRVLRNLSDEEWPEWATAALPKATDPTLPLDPPAVATMRRAGLLLAQFQLGLAAAGLHYTEHQLATFLTSLQTKGVVILSGISGTGKTKIAQYLATTMPNATARSDTVPGAGRAVRLTRTDIEGGKIYLRKPVRVDLPMPLLGETWRVQVRFGDGRLGDGTVTHYNKDAGPDLSLRGEASQWFKRNFRSGDIIILNPTLDDDGQVIAFDLGTPEDFADPSAPKVTTPNHLFLPVRPDWRDSKPLLGYYNPLTESYVRTEFLDFLLRADANWRSGEPIAWFVILDEMNLARVEYYLADLLSVLESGRDADGRTREALTFAVPDDADGWLPPRELHLPPNLYFVGTVNVDETTHAFSPKVLDRAFTIELSQADFADYPPAVGDADDLSDEVRNQLLKQFSDDGRWPVIDKAMVREIVEQEPWLRADLTDLNARLGDDGLQFAYRVFDEIACFVWRAARNGMWGGDLRAAFDEAVLMKVLPKFHGSRARLEEPLRQVLAWCAGTDPADLEQVSGVRYPRTWARAARLLRDVERDGFAAF